MKAYLSLFRIRFYVLLQYRAAAFAGFFTQFFFGFVRVMVFQAFYQSSTQQQPMSFTQAATYTWLIQATFRMMPWNSDTEVIGQIRSGNVAYELCRPMNLYGNWYCRLMAMRIVPTLMAGIPLFIITLLLPLPYRTDLPISISSGMAWLISMLAALLLGCAISNLITISTLWTLAGDGMQRIFPVLVMVLSGMTIPLAFFPDWMQMALRFLPFSGVADTPFRFYIGMIPPSQILTFLFLQIFWTAFFVFLGLHLLKIATRRVVIQGG